MTGIYLDYNSTTPLDPRVLSAMEPFWSREFGNPHSVDHAFGWHAQEVVEASAVRLADPLGFDSDEVVFTSGSTEANTLAIVGSALGPLSKSRHRILIGATEHKSVIEAAALASSLTHLSYEFVRVYPNGQLDLGHLGESMADDVLMVSVMAVNNEIGTINDICTISKMIRPFGTLLHVDATQAIACGEMASLMEADLCSISGHKMYGPKGIGALFVRRAIQPFIRPIIPGGGQQRGLRGGTIPVALVHGLASAFSLCHQEFPLEQDRLRQLRDLFLSEMERHMPDIRLVGPNLLHRHPGNLMLGLPTSSSDIVISRIQPRVAISRASACSSGIDSPSHVLTAIGLSPSDAGRCIRVSVGRFSTREEIVRAAEVIVSACDD